MDPPRRASFSNHPGVRGTCAAIFVLEGVNVASAVVAAAMSAMIEDASMNFMVQCDRFVNIALLSVA